MMQKNKTGFVFAGIYGVCVLIAMYMSVTGGEFGGIGLLIVSLPWLLIIEPFMHFLSKISVPDFGGALEIISIVVSIAFNTVFFYHIGKLLSKAWNKNTVQ